jgi:putative transposase
VIRYIEEHRARFGVEPICRTLAIAPSSYYAARSRRPSAHEQRDDELADEVARVHAEQFGVYGTRKVWRQLAREGIASGRDRVNRLMRRLGLAGVRRERNPRTTRPGPATERPADLVGRVFTTSAPNRLWVADITYVRLRSGFCYTALVVDAFSRRIVGWRVALTLRADLALDALEMALWARGRSLEGLVHHSDRGVQYLAVRYTERLAEAGIAGSVGSRGDSYDNALAESVNALYKAELIHRQGWQTVEQVELATADWIDWWNTRRLHTACGNVPPAEFEAAYAERRAKATVAAA